MRPYAKQNRGYHYILTIIDAFSKYAWAIPVKTKSGRDVTAAFATVLRQSDRCPRNLQTDMGKEFYNAEFQRCVKIRGINHYSTYSVMKASIVERFNRTLKNLMWKQFSLNASYRWVDLLPALVHTYNHRKHRTINARPVDVTPTMRLSFAANEPPSPSASKGVRRRAKFKVGDKVRVSKFKTLFEKGYTPNWSTEVFEIVTERIVTNMPDDIYSARFRGRVDLSWILRVRTTFGRESGRLSGREDYSSQGKPGIR